MSAKAQDAGETKKKKLPLPMIIGIILLVVGLFVGKSVLGGGKPAEKTKKSKKSKASKDSKHGEEKVGKHDEEEEEEKEPVEVGHAMPLEEFLVNLTGNGDHYLRATIALGLKKGLTEEKAKEHVPAIRDAILTILSEKTLKDLSNTKGRETLKEELVEKVNEAVGGEEEEEPVVKIYFTAFATQ